MELTYPRMADYVPDPNGLPDGTLLVDKRDPNPKNHKLVVVCGPRLDAVITPETATRLLEEGWTIERLAHADDTPA